MDRTQKMKAFKVWNNKRTIKKFVVGINCYEDLVTKGGEKLGVSAVKAVLEEDGTEIDNEYLEFLDPNNAIILLEQQENWTDKDNCNLPVSEGHGQLHETKKTPPVVPSGAKKQATITREMRQSSTLKFLDSNYFKVPQITVKTRV
ncbi:lipid transferase CIDEB-like isoform X2 [Montipora capricornis]|uniref:lipid transferase CIDEB-like isoform X2 n=1 Tax=Montipora capricornis TaxID=246305 RepID=UPI0035F17870